MTFACAGFLEPRGSGLRLLKSTFNAETFFCRLSVGLSPAISSHSKFSVGMCAAAKKLQKITKTPIGRGSRSFKVIDVNKIESLSIVLVMISSMSVPICNLFNTMRANSKITSFQGVPLFDALVRGESLHPGAQRFVTIN